MLTWLRTHQKGIFAVIAFVVIASFSLFGTYGDVGSKPINERDEVIRCLEQDGLKGWFEEGFGGLLVDGLAAEALKEKIAAFKGFKTSKVFDQVVKQFAPDYYADLLAFRGASGGINELVRLYGHQLKFSSEMVRRIAMYMGQEDPGDVTLFYARSIEDWFGQEFITGLADLVVAKTKGVPARFKWAAFKKKLDSVGQDIVVDKTSYLERAAIEGKGALVALYRLPKTLRVQSLDDLGWVEGYLEARGVDLLSGSEDGVEALKQKGSPLVERRFQVMEAKVKRKDVEKEMSLRKTWAWEDAHWGELQEEVVEIRGKSRSEVEGAVQEKVDAIARQKMCTTEVIAERLATMELSSVEVVTHGEEVVPTECFEEEAGLFVRRENVSGGEYRIVGFQDAKGKGLIQKRDVKVAEAAQRYAPYMNRMQQMSMAGEIAKGEWAPVCETVRIIRKDGHPLVGDDVYSMQIGDWASFSQGGEPVFLQVIDTFVDTSGVEKEMASARAALVLEAKQKVLKKWIGK